MCHIEESEGMFRSIADIAKFHRPIELEAIKHGRQYEWIHVGQI